MLDGAAGPSTNLDESGMFSVQVSTHPSRHKADAMCIFTPACCHKVTTRLMCATYKCLGAAAVPAPTLSWYPCGYWPKQQTCEALQQEAHAGIDPTHALYPACIL